MIAAARVEDPVRADTIAFNLQIPVEDKQVGNLKCWTG
jgi:hypothetical protein